MPVFDFCADLMCVFEELTNIRCYSDVHDEIGITNVKHYILFNSGKI